MEETFSVDTSWKAVGAFGRDRALDAGTFVTFGEVRGAVFVFGALANPLIAAWFFGVFAIGVASALETATAFTKFTWSAIGFFAAKGDTDVVFGIAAGGGFFAVFIFEAGDAID